MRAERTKSGCARAGSPEARPRAARLWGARALALAALSSSCALDFDVTGRRFDCPPEVVGCVECNPDGSCRVPLVIAPNEPDRPPPVVDVEPMRPPPSHIEPDASAPTLPPMQVPPAQPDPDPDPPDPTPAECAAFASRASDRICVSGSARCFTLGNVLSPALTLWLDSTSLPEDASQPWCDRSGKRHHARLVPDAARASIERDARPLIEPLDRSVKLDGGWLTLDVGTEPLLRPGNFAVIVGAATPLEAGDDASFALFASGAESRIDVAVVPDTGLAVGTISSIETSLVPDPVVTRSSVYDGGFHLYTLYRRSEVRVLDDILQLRLNGVLEFRGSSIAIPRALDLSATPVIGQALAGVAPVAAASGRGRVAAIVVLRGSVPEDELARLETFLCEALAVCAAPGPRLDAEPPVRADAGSGCNDGCSARARAR